MDIIFNTHKKKSTSPILTIRKKEIENTNQSNKCPHCHTNQTKPIFKITIDIYQDQEKDPNFLINIQENKDLDRIDYKVLLGKKKLSGQFKNKRILKTHLESGNIFGETKIKSLTPKRQEGKNDRSQQFINKSKGLNIHQKANSNFFEKKVLFQTKKMGEGKIEPEKSSKMINDSDNCECI